MIRDALPSDAEGVARVNVASWQRAYPGLIEQSFLDSLEVGARTESWNRILRQTRGRVLVAEDDGGIHGFCAIGPSTDEDWGEVYALYVDPHRWGEGVGRDLLAAGEQALIDDGHWQLWFGPIYLGLLTELGRKRVELTPNRPYAAQTNPESRPSARQV